MATKELKLSDAVSAKLVNFNGNSEQKQAAFGVLLTGPTGENLGQISLAVGPQAQPETDSQKAIPSWDDFIAASPAAAAALAALETLGMELAAFSKVLTVQDVPPA